MSQQNMPKIEKGCKDTNEVPREDDVLTTFCRPPGRSAAVERPNI